MAAQNVDGAEARLTESERASPGDGGGLKRGARPHQASTRRPSGRGAATITRPAARRIRLARLLAALRRDKHLEAYPPAVSPAKED